MINQKVKQKLSLAMRGAKHKIKGQKLRLLTIEVTKRCNARCEFCTYWYEPVKKELSDYSDIVTHFNPLVVTLSGGEPLVRKDLVEIIKQIRAKDPVVYISMVTNGALLTREKAVALREAGLNQLSISLDYAGEKHDDVRVLPGVYKHITELLPQLSTVGFEMVSLNAVIKDDNLDEIPKILDIAKENGISIGLSSYCELKTGNDELIVKEENHNKLKQLIEYIKNYKNENGVVTSSDYYLDHVIDYFANKEITGCLAGINWIQVTPAGEIKRCSEHGVVAKDYRDYDPNKVKPMSCTNCWYSCRGEAQAPINLKRIKELW